MKRLIIAMIGIAVMFTAIVAASALDRTEATGASEQSQLSLASLPLISPSILAKPPKTKFTRTIWTETALGDILPALDKCRGPVASSLGEDKPVYVAEHDYCGGSAWMWKLHVSDAVDLKGAGIDPGVYVVTKLKYFPRHADAAVSDLPDGVIVLQTCVSKTQMVFIALEKWNTL